MIEISHQPANWLSEKVQNSKKSESLWYLIGNLNRPEAISNPNNRNLDFRL